MKDGRFQELVERSTSCGLTPAEDAELAGLLSDPQQAVQAVRQRRMALLLAADDERSLTAVAALTLAASAQGSSARHQRIVQTISARRWGRRLVLIALAAIVMFGLASWWLLAAPPRIRDAHGQAVGVGPLAGEIHFQDGSRLAFATGSRAELDDHQRVHLLAGQVQASIARQSPGQPFAITTPHGSVTVLGTRFVVSVSDDTSLIVVHDGLVRGGDHSGESVEIPAGSSGAVDQDGAVRLPGVDVPGVDQRPLIGATLCNGTFPRNPHGWLQRAELDSADAAEFRRVMLDYARNLNRAAHRIGAQGIIVWGLEGWHRPDFFYPGDPRQLAGLAPEMEAIADDFFSELKKDGMTTGVVVKPGRVAQRAGRWQWERPASDETTELIGKATYAFDRWGCSRFFYGFNLTAQGQAQVLAGNRLDPHDILPWRTLLAFRRQLPQALIIPEYQTEAGWGIARGWCEASRLPMVGQDADPTTVAPWVSQPLVVVVHAQQKVSSDVRSAIAHGALPLISLGPDQDLEQGLTALAASLK